LAIEEQKETKTVIWINESGSGVMPLTRVNASFLVFHSKAYLYGGECKDKFVGLHTLNLKNFRWKKVPTTYD
jgi:hypothetical protein